MDSDENSKSSQIINNGDGNEITFTTDKKRHVDEKKPRNSRKRNKSNEPRLVQEDDLRVQSLSSSSIAQSTTSESSGIESKNVVPKVRDTEIKLSVSQKYVIDLIMQGKSVFFSGNNIVVS